MPTVYVTAPESVAAELAETLVDERLAACVNAVGCQSTYRWEGEVITDDETILLICIERFDEAEMADSFGTWIVESVD
ncbi:MAG: divalent cation tolerance protein CutA [Euryarchaeota archaeon]|nr:divalent cation tolerance protein CutA [Euryarchaeota archaeon]